MVKKRRQTACACLGTRVTTADAVWRTANRSHYIVHRSQSSVACPTGYVYRHIIATTAKTFSSVLYLWTTETVSCARVYLRDLNKYNIFILFFSSRLYSRKIFCTARISVQRLFIDHFPSCESCRRACYAPNALCPTTILSHTDEAHQIGKRCCLPRYNTYNSAWLDDKLHAAERKIARYWPRQILN